MLFGKTILITGGGSGIGESLVSQLSIDNKIIICGRNEDKLKKVSSTYKNVNYFVADISVPEEIDTLFKRIAAEKIVLDVLINNAGVVEQFAVLKTSFSSCQIFERINTNLSGGIAVTLNFINQANLSVENIIVNITSEVAFFPIPILALYSTSKTGFSVFTKTLRQQLKHTNFKVIEILPPQIETDMSKQLGAKSKGEDVNIFTKKIIKAINQGKKEFAGGSSVPLLKIFSKFLPKFGLNLIDKMSRKQIEIQ